MMDARAVLLRCSISVPNLCRVSSVCTRGNGSRRRALLPGELWSSDWFLSLLFLGVGQLECHLADELQELSVLSLQLDDL